jgi:5-hydroxyisourate hydrolase-like protein (transthyretin family)
MLKGEAIAAGPDIPFYVVQRWLSKARREAGAENGAHGLALAYTAGIDGTVMLLRTISVWLAGTVWLSGATLQAQVPSGSSASPTPKAETCVISGMVVRREDSAPLKGAVVQLVNAEDQDRAHTIAAKSKADGRFELKNVPAGKYRLTVSRNGYFRSEYGQKKPSDPGATFSLVPGQRMSDLLFKMGRAGVIAGHVFDEDGEPMPSLVIMALRTVYEKGRKELRPETDSQSNDLGEFRLYGLAPGRYYISAQDQNWTHVVGEREFAGEEKSAGEKGYTQMYYPGTTDPGKAAVIVVKEGEEIPAIDFLMKEVSVYRIRGRVVNQVSKGTRQGMIQILPRNQRNYWMSYGLQNIVKPDGSFEIAEVVPGEYTAIAQFFDDGKIHTAEQDVDVTAADIEGLTLTIGPGVTISGRIIWDGQPSLSREEFTVYLRSESVEFWSGGSSRVDENNQFTLKEVADGVFKVNLSGLSKDCYIKEVRYGESTLPDTELRVGKGTSGSLEITISSRGARVEGSVLTEESLPAAGVWVVAIPEESKRQFERLYKSDRTDQNGHFSLRGLVPGKYKLFSWSSVEEGAWQDADFLKEFEGKGETVDVQDGDVKQAELQLIQAKR